MPSLYTVLTDIHKKKTSLDIRDSREVWDQLGGSWGEGRGGGGGGRGWGTLRGGGMAGRDGREGATKGLVWFSHSSLSRGEGEMERE